MDTHTMLRGRERRPAAIWFLAAIACFLFGLLVFASGNGLGLLIILVGPAVCAIAQAAQNDGLVASWAITGFGTAGFAGLFMIGSHYVGPGPTVVDLAKLQVQTLLVGGVMLGTITFGIGVSTRRIWKRWSRRTE